MTTAWAPSARAASARCSPLTSAVTCAPPATASCTANEPTPPVAPVTSTRRPSRSPPSRSARRAVSPATGSAAASAKVTASGSAASAMAGHGTPARPAAAVGRSGNARPGRRAAAVGGRARDHAGEVLARAPAVGALLEQVQLAAVDRVRADVDERVVIAGLGRRAARGGPGRRARWGR